MNVISRRVVDKFIKKHADAKVSLLSWYRETCSANWQTAQDIKDRYPSASFLHSNTVIFNIGGNKYRVVTKIAYRTKTVFIKWIGTHAEYNKQNF